MIQRFEDKYNWNKLSVTPLVTYFKVKTDIKFFICPTMHTILIKLLNC